MEKYMLPAAFILLIIGTIGLLVNEFSAGIRCVTLIFAAINLFGLAAFALSNPFRKKAE